MAHFLPMRHDLKLLMMKMLKVKVMMMAMMMMMMYLTDLASMMGRLTTGQSMVQSTK